MCKPRTVSYNVKLEIHQDTAGNSILNILHVARLIYTKENNQESESQHQIFHFPGASRFI